MSFGRGNDGGKGLAPCLGLAARTSVRGDEADAKPRFGQQHAVPQRALVHAAGCGAHFLHPAFDQHVVVQPGRSGIADGKVGHGIGTLARFLRGALVTAAAMTAAGERDKNSELYLEAEFIDASTGKPVLQVVRKGFGKNLDNIYNPRRMTFFEYKSVSDVSAPKGGFIDGAGGNGTLGALYDPWGRQYNIIIVIASRVRLTLERRMLASSTLRPRRAQKSRTTQPCGKRPRSKCQSET